MELPRETIEELTLVIEHRAYEHYRSLDARPHEVASENVLRAMQDGILDEDLRLDVQRQILSTSAAAGRLSLRETMAAAWAI